MPKPTEEQIRELSERLLDRRHTSDDLAALQEAVSTSSDAQDSYLETVMYDVLLAELIEEQPTVKIAPRQSRTRVLLWVGLATAAAVTLVAIVLHNGQADNVEVAQPDPPVAAPADPKNEVLMQTATDEDVTLQLPGVLVVLQRASRYYVVSPSQLVLAEGALSAHVSPSGEGFRVDTPAGTFIDRGTIFHLRVDESTTELHVSEGRVEAILNLAELRTIVEEEQAIRVFATSRYEPIPFDPDSFPDVSVAPTEIRPWLSFGCDGSEGWSTIISPPDTHNRVDARKVPMASGTARFAIIDAQSRLPNTKASGAFLVSGKHRARAGRGRLLPLPFHARDKLGFIIASSPPFYFPNDPGMISAWFCGGASDTTVAPKGLAELGEANPEGFMGIALRRLGESDYLCSVASPLAPPGYSDRWRRGKIDRETVAKAIVKDPPGQQYVLDVIDLCSGRAFGWIGIDEVAIEGGSATLQSTQHKDPSIRSLTGSIVFDPPHTEVSADTDHIHLTLITAKSERISLNVDALAPRRHVLDRTNARELGAQKTFSNVRAYSMHFNTGLTHTTPHASLQRKASVTFKNPILGIIFRERSLDNAYKKLSDLATIIPDHQARRGIGLESKDIVTFRYDRRTVTLEADAHRIDQIVILTHAD